MVVYLAYLEKQEQLWWKTENLGLSKMDFRASQVALVVKNLPANAGDLKDMDLILGSRRSPAGGHGDPLQYSCLESPMDRGTWRATVHRVAKSRTRLCDLACMHMMDFR